MAFESTNAFQLWSGSLANGRGAGWLVVTADTTSDASGAGWLAGVMRGGRSNNLGMSTGDIVFTFHGSSALVTRMITGSTIDQGTTSASSAFNYGYDGSLTP